MEQQTLLDCILELKKRCDFESTIAGSFRITVSELHCLLHLDEEQNVYANVLCKKMDLSKSRGSRIIGGLAKKGFITVQADEEDRRFLRLDLTRSGKSCIEAIRAERKKCEHMLKVRLHPGKYSNAKRTIRGLLEIINGEDNGR